MFSKVILAAMAATALAVNTRPVEFYEKEFFEHMQTYNLQFKDGAEFISRLRIFADNLDLFEKHNADKTQTYTLGVNQFTHLTFDEFLKEVNIGGTRIPNLRRNPEGGLYEAPADDAAPVATVDWTTKGAVTSVKNQGSCGSCWSFSAAGALEGAKWIKYKSTESLSEQQLVACDTAGNDKGCNGGWMDDAFKWIKGNGGLCSEAAYPYASSSGTSPSCKKGCTPVSGTAVSGWTDVTPKSVSALASAVSTVPVAIAIQANQPAFQSYKSGVLTGTCGQRLDHGVLLVGYGTDNGLDYWKVKNSWGTSWGEQGYIRIEKSSKDLCGVLDAPSFVTVV